MSERQTSEYPKNNQEVNIASAQAGESNKKE